MAVCEYRFCPTHEFAGHVWNYENQHGSLLGQCNELGDRMIEFEYSDYGLTLDRPSLADGRTGNLGGISYDGGNGITSITFSNGTDVSSFTAAEVRVARPGTTAAANR